MSEINRPSEISIVICSIHDDKLSRVCENYARVLGEHRYEIVHIGDAKSLAEGYNRGFSRSTGEIVIFSHDDIEILSSNFARCVLGRLQSFDLIGVAGTSRVMDGSWFTAGQPNIHGHIVQPAREGTGFTYDVFDLSSPVCGGVQALDGLFFAAKRHVLESIRFDGQSFDGFHVYDIDFSYRAYLAGFRLAICNDILICHDSLGNRDEKWVRYLDVFAKKFSNRLPSFAKPGPSNFWQRRVDNKDQAIALYETRLRQLQTGRGNF